MNIKHILFLLGVFLAGLALPCLGLDNPEQKVTETVKSYIMGKYPDWPKDDIRLTYKMAEGVFAELKALPDGASLEVIEVYPDFKPVGTVVFPLRAAYDAAAKKFMVRAKVEVVRQIVAAARLVRKGQLITRDDLKTEPRDVALLPQKYFLSSDPLVSQEAKITIPENSTIFEWMVGGIPLVRRGKTVTLLVSAPGLTVKARAEAQEDGGLGSEIRVKRSDSRKVVTATIISADEVEVNL